jgi:hypothetical protein
LLQNITNLRNAANQARLKTLRFQDVPKRSDRAIVLGYQQCCDFVSHVWRPKPLPHCKTVQVLFQSDNRHNAFTM